jgi:hypothetical protein
LDALRECGDLVSDTLLAHPAPGGWQYINLTGIISGLRTPTSVRMGQAAADHTASRAHLGCGLIKFPIRASNRAILPVLCRDPGSALRGSGR